MGFGPPITPPIIKNLLIANGVVFLAQIMSSAVTDLGVVIPRAVWGDLELWRPFTYMWLHAVGSPMHIVFNLLALWMFGSPLAMLWGERRFIRYYLTCGVGAGIIISVMPYIPILLGISSPNSVGIWMHTLGASGAVMGILLAYAFTWPDRTIMLIFPPIPIKAIYLIPFIFFMEFASGPSNVSHSGHLGGVITGWIYLVREGRTPGAPTFKTLQHRYRRYMMRRKIRAVHEEDRRERERWNDRDGGGSGRYH